jgi:hypothetical protein
MQGRKQIHKTTARYSWGQRNGKWRKSRGTMVDTGNFPISGGRRLWISIPSTAIVFMINNQPDIQQSS